jgi:hypothetical protein
MISFIIAALQMKLRAAEAKCFYRLIESTLAPPPPLQLALRYLAATQKKEKLGER